MRRLAVLALAATLAGVAQAATYVDLPGGRFESVLPQGAVPTVSTPVDIAPFAMRSEPVTVREFAAFVQAHPEWQRGQAPSLLADHRYLLQWEDPRQPGASVPAAAPVTEVSWFAARA